MRELLAKIMRKSCGNCSRIIREVVLIMKYELHQSLRRFCYSSISWNIQFYFLEHLRLGRSCRNLVALKFIITIYVHLPVRSLLSKFTNLAYHWMV